MGTVVVLALAVLFVAFRVWLVTQHTRVEDPSFVRHARHPRVVTAVTLLVTGVFALALAVEAIPRWLGAIGIVAIVLAARLLSGRAESGVASR